MKAGILLFFKLPLSWWLRGKESTCQCRRHGFDPWVRKTPWRRKCQSTPVFSLGKAHEQRSLVGYSPWGRKKVKLDLATKPQQQTVMVGQVSGSLDRYVIIQAHISDSTWSKLP